MSNARSDEIHNARRKDLGEYATLVEDELAYKAQMVDRALDVLDQLPDSRLRSLYRELEAASQEVWRRRLQLHAFDLVRFGRTSWVWRNNHVPMLDADKKCADQLTLLGNPQVARDMAVDAGTREVALATVIAVDPLRLQIASRRLTAGTSIAALHVNGQPVVEDPAIDVKVQKGSFKFSGLTGGELAADDETPHDAGLTWHTSISTTLAVGDELIIANRDWFGGLNKPDQILVKRPGADKNSAPKDNCHDGSYASDPDNHGWCCRPHEQAEAEFSDILAERRARGELNPQAWPPVIDADQFDTPAADSPTDANVDAGQTSPPEGLTMDDLD